MSGPAWIPGTLAALMALTALTCAARLVVLAPRRRGAEVGVDVLHVAMGAVMAAMLLGRLDPRTDLLWLVVFGCAGLWFARQGIAALVREGWASRAAGHGLAHGLVCAAMLLMLLGPGVSSASAASSVLSGATRANAMGAMGMGSMTGIGPAGAGLVTGSLVPLGGAGMIMAAVIAVLAALQLRTLVRTGGAEPPLFTPGAGRSVSRPIARSRSVSRSISASPPVRGIGTILQPRWAGICQLAMCVSMAYALIVMF